MVLKICNEDGIIYQEGKNFGIPPVVWSKSHESVDNVFKCCVDGAWHEYSLDSIEAVFLMNGSGDTIERIYHRKSGTIK